MAETHRLGSWDDVRYFLAVVRRGGLSAAARELGVNQSTVFRRVTQFEARLGARLFDREARGYRPTAAAEAILPHALRLEDDALALERAAVGADHDLSGAVRVSTVDEVLLPIAGQLRQFRERYPRIELELHTELRVVSLTRREADVAIRPGPKPTEPEVVGRPLVPLSLAAYAAPGYLAGRARPKRFEDLAQHSLVRFPLARGAASEMHPALEEAPTACTSNSMNAHAILARAGIGVAFLPTFMGDEDPGVERLFSVPRRPDYHLWLLIHADLRQTARVRAFVDFMTDAIRHNPAFAGAADAEDG